MEPTSILPEGYKPQPQDILCGKTKLAFNHVGNLDFRATVAMFLKPYEELRSRTERGVLIANVVDMIHNSGCRFLKQNACGRWVVQTTQQSRSKVGHALRDTSANTKGNPLVENKRLRLDPSVPPPLGPMPAPPAPGPQPTLQPGRSSDLQSPSVPMPPCQRLPQRPQAPPQFFVPPPQAVVYTGPPAGARQYLKQHPFVYYYGSEPTEEERSERRSSHGIMPRDDEGEIQSYQKRTQGDQEKEERHSGDATRFSRGKHCDEEETEHRIYDGKLHSEEDEEKRRNYYEKMHSEEEKEEPKKIYSRMSSDGEGVEKGAHRWYYGGSKEAMGETRSGRMRSYEESERLPYYHGKMPVGQGGDGEARYNEDEMPCENEIGEHRPYVKMASEQEREGYRSYHGRAAVEGEWAKRQSYHGTTLSEGEPPEQEERGKRRSHHGVIEREEEERKGHRSYHGGGKKEYQFLCQPKVNRHLLEQSTTHAETPRQQTNRWVAFDGDVYYYQEKEESDDDNDDHSTSPSTAVQPEVVSSSSDSSQQCRKRNRNAYDNDGYENEYSQDASLEEDEEEDESTDEPSNGQVYRMEVYGGGEPDQDVDEEQYTHDFEAPEHTPSCTIAAAGDDGVVHGHDGYVYRDNRWQYVCGKDGPPAAAPTDETAEVSSVVSDSSDDCYQDFDDFVCQRQPRMGVRA